MPDTEYTTAELMAIAGPPRRAAPAPARRQPAPQVRFANDRDALIRTVLGEAGAEPPEGQTAVAAVVLNRARQRGLSPSEVVLERNQFEPWGNPQTAARLMSVSPNDPAYQAAARQVDAALQGQDPTNGADHFYAPRAQAALGRDAPGWAQGDPLVIGGHNFYSLGGSTEDARQSAAAAMPDYTDEELKQIADGVAPAPAQGAPGSSRENPIDLSALTNDSVQALRKGAWVTNPKTGETYALPGDAWFGKPDSSSERVGSNAYLDRPDMGDTALAAATAFSEQIPFGDELVAAGAGALSGRGYDAIRQQQATERELLNQTNRTARNVGGVAGFGAGFALPGGKWVDSAQGAARLGRAAAIGGGYGALYGAGNTDGGLTDRLSAGAIQGAIGAGGGAVLQRGADALGALARNARANPSPARQLSAAGVDLTPGQMLGGAARRLEDGATSIPILGDAIRDARIRGLESFNQAAINQAIRPVNGVATRGRQGIQEADTAISNAYDAALQGVQVPRDGAFDAQITQIARSNPLPGELQPQFNALLNNTLQRIGQGMDGRAWKQLDSELAAAVRAAQNGSQTNPAQRLMADKLGQMRDAVRGMLDRSDPAAAAAVSQADQAAAGMYRIRDAAQSLGTSARDGIFTPGDLNRAVRNGDTSAGNRQFARGEAMLQGLSDAAAQVLPSTVPDSGTPFRSMLAVGGVGGGATTMTGGAALPVVAATGAGLFGGAGAYSRPVQGILNRAYRASTPGAARQALADLQAVAAQTPALQPVYEALQSALRPLLLGGQTAISTTP